MYLAIATWHLLTNPTTTNRDENNYVNIQSATSYILSCVSYDGLNSLTPEREGHRGLRFYGTAFLCLLGMQDDFMAREEMRGWREDLVWWCIMRQCLLPKGNDDGDEEEKPYDDYYDWEKSAAGMQGRPNKPQDTCYSY